MTYHYTITPEKLKHSAPAHLNHRFPIRRFLFPILGVLYFLGGGLLLLNHTLDEPTFPLMMVALGVLFLIRRPLTVRRMTKNAFAGKKEKINISITVHDDDILLVSENTESTIRWDSFVDLKILPDGILLYTQKLIYMWIPNDGTFDDGCWGDFTTRFQNNITPKI